MLFGVRVVVDSMRKCVSLNNLSDYEKSSPEEEMQKTKPNRMPVTPPPSDDCIRLIRCLYWLVDYCLDKTGVAWKESEHKRFLRGLQRVGKGDSKAISRNFVKSRTPTQVASHAQKYFLRRTNLNRRTNLKIFHINHSANPSFNLNRDAAPLSLNLSLSFNLNEPSNSRHSIMPSFSDGDSNSNIIRVA